MATAGIFVQSLRSYHKWDGMRLLYYTAEQVPKSNVQERWFLVLEPRLYSRTITKKVTVRNGGLRKRALLE